MKSIEEAILIANNHTKEGRLEEALESYSDLFNMLTDMALQYAITETGSSSEDKKHLESIAETLMEFSKEYLKKDAMAATVLNEMGLLFEALGDMENAEQKFTEAVVYTPRDFDYSEPQDNLNRIERLKINYSKIQNDYEQ